MLRSNLQGNAPTTTAASARSNRFDGMPAWGMVASLLIWLMLSQAPRSFVTEFGRLLSKFLLHGAAHG